MKTNGRATAYARVSTEDQVESRLGLDAQRSAIRAAADRLGLDVTTWHADEGVSGAASIERREGLLRAMETLGEGDVLLIARRDRLSRDVMQSCWLEKEIARRGARVVSAAGEGTDNDDPSSILMRRIIDSFSEYERKVIAARTKAALRAKKERGEVLGAAPYGYRRVGDVLVEDETEQRTVRLIEKVRSQGMTYQQIAETLRRQGIETKNGGSWHSSTVGNICRRLCGGVAV